jgi:hypothetical protein
MRAEDLNQAVHRHLFSDEDCNVFATLDGASVPYLLDKLYGLLPEFECLFRGELEPDIAEVAPYLVQLEPFSEFTKWVVTHGWGQHWGIFAASTADFRALRQHFRTLLTVYDATGKPMLFRYYDPRVLRTYLPTCSAGELSAVFGPITTFMIEDTDPWTLLRFGIDSGSLSKEEFRLEEAAAENGPAVLLRRAQS